MAGRGGFSRQSSSSLRPEQLQTMGVMGKDMPSATVAPPPTFPPLINRLVQNTFCYFVAHLILYKPNSSLSISDQLCLR